MVENIRKIEKKIDKNKIILLFCYDFHWKNIQFLLKNPDKKEIWDYYFTKNRIIKSAKEIESELKEKNKELHKFWKLKSGFYGDN